MVRTVMMIGLLAVSTIGALTTHANAAFIGFSIRGYSELTAVINLNEVKNLKFDQEVTIAGSLNFIEVLCLNPQTFAVMPGNAGSAEIATTQAVTQADLTDRQGNKATLTIHFGGDVLAAVEQEAQDAGVCNNLWTVLEGSAAAKSLSLTLSQNRVTNQGFVVVDSVDIICTLNPILRETDQSSPEFGKPLHDQVFTCSVVN